mgnify:CR=1 FL=1
MYASLNQKIGFFHNGGVPIIKIIIAIEYIFKYLTKNKVEFRRGNAGGGNQMRQPYLKKIIKLKNFNDFQNVEHVHHFGYYIGNFPTLTQKKIIKLVNIINNY